MHACNGPQRAGRWLHLFGSSKLRPPSPLPPPRWVQAPLPRLQGSRRSGGCSAARSDSAWSSWGASVRSPPISPRAFTLINTHTHIHTHMGDPVSGPPRPGSPPPRPSRRQLPGSPRRRLPRKPRAGRRLRWNPGRPGGARTPWAEFLGTRVGPAERGPPAASARLQRETEAGETEAGPGAAHCIGGTHFPHWGAWRYARMHRKYFVIPAEICVYGRGSRLRGTPELFWPDPQFLHPLYPLYKHCFSLCMQPPQGYKRCWGACEVSLTMVQERCRASLCTFLGKYFGGGVPGSP